MDLAPFVERLQQIRRAGGTRSLEPHAGRQGPVIRIAGESLLNFCSNDYLGLAGHPALIEALAEGARRHGVGSGAAALLSGYSDAHEELARELAICTGYERALIFSSGYLANLGLLAGLVERGDRVLSDTLNHASLIDGVRLARAQNPRYLHADVDHLACLLATSHPQRTWVVTDGLFSMDGDLAPLRDISAIAARHEAILVCDDAHGFGTLGQGRGTLAELGLGQAEVPLLVVTFGKALGTAGAAVLGPSVLIENLLQQARTFIFDTAASPALMHATRVALGLALAPHSPRLKLQENIRYFRACLEQAGLPLPAGSSAIQPLLVGEGAQALRLAAALRARGLYVRAIRPPTVPQGTARLRICLSAAHEASQIERLVEALVAHRQLLGAMGR